MNRRGRRGGAGGEENRRQGREGGEIGREGWRERLGAKEQWHVCVTHKTHHTHFNTPLVRMINDSVQYRLQGARNAQVIFPLECPFTPGVSDTLILLTAEVDWQADSLSRLKTKP